MSGFLSDLPPELVTGSGFASLVFAGFWLVMTGRLVPKSLHEETRADRDAWRKAAEDSESARRVQARQIDELLDSAKATEKLMTTMQQALERHGGGGR